MAVRTKKTPASIHATGHLDVCAAALAESERACAGLLAANGRLYRSNAELRRMELAVAQGFDALDDWMEGRLRELVEQAGDELAALVNLVLDGREGSA